MARRPREWEPGGIYHVFSRGSNKQAVFVYDSDRLDLLEYVGVVGSRYRLVFLAYALMTNHCHFLVRTPVDPANGLSNAFRDLHGTYARRFNRRYGREAHVFRNRFGAVLQESVQQLQWTLRYIARNPVEAGLCAHPSEWPWTSYRATARLAEAPRFLAVHDVLSYFGDTPQMGAARYVEFVDTTPLNGGV